MFFEYFVVLLSLHVGTHVSEFASESLCQSFRRQVCVQGFNLV